MVDALLDEGRSPEVALDDRVEPRPPGAGQPERDGGTTGGGGGIAERGRDEAPRAPRRTS
ncbi:hypothetical protein [Streptomyces californicus]